MSITINNSKYVSLTDREKEKAIKFIKDNFEAELASSLGLERVSAPLFVSAKSGINDDLSGVERKVSFNLKDDKNELEVIQSLAKWKRMALSRYGYKTGEGLYTDMNAIRRDDKIDQIHSIYVDQWDWEKIISNEDRSIEYLKNIVNKIVSVLVSISKRVNKEFPKLKPVINPDVLFITGEELLKKYPGIDAKEREYKICKEYKTVFIIGIGHNLTNNEPHDLRAPDYDDWDLNGDLLVYDETIDCALELSSMGIRVNEKSLASQLKLTGTLDRLEYPYHKMIIKKELPYTVGGGIGQSRICLLLMQQFHIGQVQASYWPDDELKECEKKGIKLL